MTWLLHCVFQIRKEYELTDYFCLVIFLFNQSNNNDVFEPRTGHF